MSAAPIVIAASVKHTATIIFLHGLGDTGHGWANAISTMKAPHVKVICPTAPTMPVSLNAGFQMTSWFDLKTLDANGPEDEEGIKRAAQSVHKLIDSETEQGIEPSRIVLGGFSQGGALALYSALVYPKQLAGVMALSCWLPLHKSFPSAAELSGRPDKRPDITFDAVFVHIYAYQYSKITKIDASIPFWVSGNNADIPIVQCHGDCDPIVQYKWGQMTASYLKSFAKNVEFKTYRGMMHSSSDQEMRDLKEFVDKYIPAV